MPQPPVLPSPKVARAARVARLHGGCVLYVAGAFAVLAAGLGDWLGAATSALVAGAGAMERHGGALLRQNEPRSTAWLAGSQAFLFATIAGYCALQLARTAAPPVPALLRPLLEAPALQWRMTEEALLGLLYRVVLWTVLLASVFYQGGLALYYAGRRPSGPRPPPA